MDTFKITGMGIASPATAAGVGATTPPPPPAGFPKPIPNPYPPKPPKPVPPAPRPSPLPPDQLKPPANVAGELLAFDGGGPFTLNNHYAKITWTAPAIQPTNTTYEIYCERDGLTRLPSEDAATEPELSKIVVHTQGKTSFGEVSDVGLKNAPLAVGESVRFYVVARCPNGTLTPQYKPNLFGIKITLRRIR